MKITFENMELGLTRYLDQELKNQYAEDSVQRVVIGIGISLLLKQKLQEAKAMLESDLMKNSGIVDEDGMINVDLLRDTIKSEMTESGIRYENKLLGTITFHKEDVDTIYKYMTAVR